MIKMNLASQLQSSSKGKGVARPSYGWIGVVLCLGIVVAGWWLVQSQQLEYEYLLQEKHLQTESFDKLQATLTRLKQYQEEKELLSETLAANHTQKLGQTRPIALLDGVSRSIGGLDIWLDRVQMVGQVVELRGESFSLEEIGTYIDELESLQVITSSPVVEILDKKIRESGEAFSFIIRFDFGKPMNT